MTYIEKIGCYNLITIFGSEAAQMQYELDLSNYKDIGKEYKLKTNSWLKISVVKLVVIFIVGILLGRVVLLLNRADNQGIAPFGIAYLIAIFTVKRNKKKCILASIGVCIGYLSMKDSINDLYIYLVSIVILSIYYLLISTKDKVKSEIISFGILFSVFSICGTLISKYEVGINLTLSLLQTLLIISIYHVIKYSLKSLDELNINSNVSAEEIASISILFCLIITGIGEIYILNYSIRNIMALTSVLIIAYIGGANYGAMIGVSMGLILGISESDMVLNVAFYGVGGLIVGIFKDTGKILSILAGIIIYFSLALYSNQLTTNLIIEVLVGAGLFLLIPKSAYRSIEIEINPERKKNVISNISLNDIKEEFTLKIRSITDVLSAISTCLGEGDDNKNLLIKNKSCALVENLAERSCNQCIKRDICWQKNFNQTYISFQSLLNNYENGKPKMPKELEKKCIKHLSILKNSEAIINNHNLNEDTKEKIYEGRQVLSEHINNIGVTLGKILDDFKREITISDDLERIIKRGLNKNFIDYNGVFCYTNYEGRIKIKISMNNCEGCDLCSKNILPVLNDIIKVPLSISGEGCNINPKNNECTITIEEAPKYYVRSYAAIDIKNGEIQTGDYYSFGKTTDGYYTIILSDGMGSGPEAGEQSKSTVNLVEHLTEAGFGEDITVNTVNSIMGMKFAENEKFATLDLSKINLYNGKASFIKIGASPSFIKKRDGIHKVASKNLPFGLVDEVEVEVINEEVKPGDMIISVSDGILDTDKLNVGDDSWIEEYLKENNYDPIQLSENILKKAKELSNGVLQDDMTVVVSKIYSIS